MTNKSPVRPVIEPLLKAAEVAGILGISKTQAYRIMGAQLPAVIFGRVVRVKLCDLNAFIDAKVQRGRDE